ncbi:MAG: flagellar biosynthesis protein FlhB [Alphaproteobacteria bacterium]|nr:flagellar biosynthesis protein FlhB [Alphaproteobacteria bacterium]OJV44945.1 MAG: flagellar biosynthesis protein FlhB [Alphaproteobacteria bacterium 43-37]
MAEDNQDESLKTEEPTAHRLEEARKKGQVVLSREVVTWFVLSAAALNIAYIFPMTARSLLVYLSQFLAKTEQIHITPESLKLMSIDWLSSIIKYMFVPFTLVMAIGIFGTSLQTRFATSAESLKPALKKISVLQGFKRLFSAKSMVEFVKGIIKILVVGVTLFYILKPSLNHVDRYLFFSQDQILGQIYKLSVQLFVAVISIMIVVAILDYLFQKREFLKQLRMSRFEIMQEHKEMEGDPQIKAKLKQIRMDRGRKRMMAAVPQAAVVITNPTHYAVALKYNEDEMDAPVVVAKGSDLVALKIREIATENWVPIVQNPPLAQTLYKDVDLDSEIHADHYKAVAEVIRYVNSLKQARTLY